MISDSNEVLFLFPNMHYDTPVAANIWGKNLARAFALAGIKPTVLYMGHSPMRKRVDAYGVRYKALPVLSAWAMGVPKLRGVLLPIFQKQQINKVKYRYKLIVPLEGPYTLKREKFKIECIHRAGAKYFFTILEHPRRNARAEEDVEYEVYMNAIANMYDAMLVITEYIRDIFVTHGRTKPILVNPIIVDTKLFRHTEQIETEHPIQNLLYCGNLCHEEEMEILLREFAMIVKKHSYAKLKVIGGGGSRKQTEELVSRYRNLSRILSINNSVEFSGRLPNDKVAYQYTDADAFLLPRPFREYSEAGFPTKLGEYLATGKPVIAYATGDIPKYLTHKETAYLAMDDHEGTFASLVIEAMSDSNARSIGRNGRAIAESSFSIGATAKRLRNFFVAHKYLLE